MKLKTEPKITSWMLLFICLYFIIRVGFCIISAMFGTTPFICYDDIYIYDQIKTLTHHRIMNLFTFRNSYYLICMVLNKIRIFNVITGPRILNFILFFFLCIIIKNITELLGYDRKSTKTVLWIMLLSPYYIIYSLVPLREVICAIEVFYIIWTFLHYEKGGKINVFMLLIVMTFLYFTRTYVLEIMALVFGFYVCKNSKWQIKALLVICSLLVIAYFIFHENYYMYVLDNKIEHYVLNGTGSTGLLDKLSIRGIFDIYKLVLLLPYVQITPLPGAIESYYTMNSWCAWVTLSSGIAAFFVPFFWIHIYRLIRIKKTSLEKVIAVFYMIFLLILALTEPGNARFMFFNSPIFYMFAVNEFIRMKRKNNSNIIIGVFCACIPYVYLLI